MISSMRLVFYEGYRVFFLAAGLFAVFAGAVWSLSIGVQMEGGFWNETPFSVAPHIWHGHEMIFGYSSAALGGFLLTAVPNWTGEKSARVVFIATAATLWLAGRVALWFSASINPILVAILDLSFLPIIMLRIAQMLMKRPKPQNVMFLGFLTAFWSANLLVHLEWIGFTGDSALHGMRAGLIALCVMIGILGGRVTPAFTRNAMKRAGMEEEKWPTSRDTIEKAALVSAVILPLAVLFALPDMLCGVLAMLAGALQLVRLSHWRGAWTIGQPILLSLHAGIAMLAIGLLLWGAANLGLGDEIAALHVLGIGAVGGMTLAVMSRAVLGHSGRPLIAPRPVALAYLLVAVAAIIRWAGSIISAEWYFPMALFSGILWCLSFALYTVSIWPAVTTPRVPEAD